MDPEHRDHPIKVIGRYALYGKLASGGMATVHFGRLLGPAGFSRTVAIKRLHPQFAKDPEFVAMFLDEARLAARIQHPNVVATVDVVAMQEELFLVMDYIRGESFSRLMRASRKRDVDVSLGVVTSVIAGMLHGLHAAHEARDERGQPLCVVHRDVSPQNVLVGVDGIARVLDFGVAKAAARIQITRDGQMKGKLAYMAPEQLQGKVVDRRTDVFAAGIVLWEALTGRRLFDAEEASEVLRMIVSEEIPPPSAVVPSVARVVDDIVMRALARDPAKRYETARQFAIALEEAAVLASAREVGEWVEAVAGDTLLHREQAVAEIEAVSEPSVKSQSVRPPGKRLSGTPPPRTVPDLKKPWEADDPTRISTSSPSIGTAKSKPTAIQVPRPSARPPPPPLAPEQIGFGALLDDDARTNVVRSPLSDGDDEATRVRESPLDVPDDEETHVRESPLEGSDEEQTHVLEPPGSGEELPTSLYVASGAAPGAGDADRPSVTAARALLLRERGPAPTIIVQEPTDPQMFRRSSALDVAIGWLWDNPNQRMWRVAAAAGTFAMLLGFGVVAGKGGHRPPRAQPAQAPTAASLARTTPPVESPARGIDPSTLPVADDDAPGPPAHAASRGGVESAAAREQPSQRRGAPGPAPSSAPEPPPAELDETENPYSRPGSPRPSRPPSPSTAAAPPAQDNAPPGCRPPYMIDANGIKRVKPECL